LPDLLLRILTAPMRFYHSLRNNAAVTHALASL